jgi:glutamate:GABA antiporter
MSTNVTRQPLPGAIEEESFAAHTSLPSESYVERALPPIHTTLDLTILFVVILFFITNDSTAVAGGPAGLTLWVIGGLFFFIPCSIATAQLGVLFTHEGSLYSWTHKTFGGFMSFFVGFSAWVPGSLLILATSDLVVSIVQGLNPKWLADPRSQGIAMLVIIAVAGMIAVQRQRTIQNMVNVIFVALLLGTALVFLSGLVWLAHGKSSVTPFNQPAGWNPFTSANYPLFGTIVLGFLGVNLPLNVGGELAASNEGAKRRSIKGHLLWGSLIVLACYLASTFGVLVVQGQNASFNLYAPVSTVSMALGPLAGDITAVCIMITLIIATVVYTYIFARFLLVGGIDGRLPSGLGSLNRNRVPSNAILLQTVFAGILVALFFLVIPYIGVLSGPPAHLAASFYFVSVGAATLIWAFATCFLFVNLLRLMARNRGVFRHHQIFPTWLLVSSSVIGLVVGLAAIIDTVLNTYDPLDIPNGSWVWFVTGLTVALLIIGAIASMLGNGEAGWQKMSDTQ